MKIGIIGSTGTIGSALIAHLSKTYPDSKIHGFSSKPNHNLSETKIIHHQIDYSNEDSIKEAAQHAFNNEHFDMIIVATGLLHEGTKLKPEKALRDLCPKKFHTIFQANTIFPAITAKHFLPLLKKNERAVFAAISARVGSISDNVLGGWYAYRASKAALNMIIKNAAIEMGRRHKYMIILGLHPGTVDSSLSEPFQGQVKEGKLFTPEYSAKKLLEVIQNSSPENSGKCFAWDGQEIPP